MELRAVTNNEIIIRILVALVLGGILGFERGLKNRPAGLRTYMLVSVGACLIMLTNQYIFQVFKTGDPVRMGAQVVSGIGFLGAGTIIVTRQKQIKGLTTAAGLWASAAIGLAIGIGFYEAAFVAGIAIFVVLTCLHRCDTLMHRKAKYAEVYIELSGSSKLGMFIMAVRALDVEVDGIQIDSDNAVAGENQSFIISLKAQKRINHTVLLDKLQKMPEVAYAEVL